MHGGKSVVGDLINFPGLVYALLDENGGRGFRRYGMGGGVFFVYGTRCCGLLGFLGVK